MWQTLAPSPNASDLVVDATMRMLPATSAVFLLLSVLAGLLALTLTARNAWTLREQNRRQDRDLQALRARERRLRLTVQDSEDGVVHLDPIRDESGAVVDFRVSEGNARAATLFRRDASELHGFRTSALASLAPDTPLFRALADTVDRGTIYRAEVRAHPREVATSWLRVRAVAVDGGLALTLTDIRERKREAARLRRASMTDALTGLVNRRGFVTTAEAQLAHARAAGEDMLLFYVDCDGFKQLNDVHGHLTGDRALKEIGRALRSAVRETDVVGRMGGDEFTILAVDAIGDCADQIRSRIYEQIDALNSQHLLPAPVAVSIGHVYIAHTNTNDLESLLAAADQDLYHHKRSRRAARLAIDAISKSTRSPLARSTGRRPASPSQLTGVTSAA
jgi:diguanylate cyclase (GGDEF)-like protein